jgi:hypothetical protein
MHSLKKLAKLFLKMIYFSCMTSMFLKGKLEADFFLLPYTGPTLETRGFSLKSLGDLRFFEISIKFELIYNDG